MPTYPPFSIATRDTRKRQNLGRVLCSTFPMLNTHWTRSVPGTNKRHSFLVDIIVPWWTLIQKASLRFEVNKCRPWIRTQYLPLQILLC